MKDIDTQDGFVISQSVADRAFGIARRIVGNREDAEDVVSEAVEKYWRRHSRGVISGLKPWEKDTYLLRTVQNTGLDWLDRRRHRPITVALDEIITDPVDPTADRVFQSIDDCDHQSWIRQTMARLSQADQELLTLLYKEQLTYQEIADQNGIAKASVRSRRHRTMKRLREAIASKP